MDRVEEFVAEEGSYMCKVWVTMPSGTLMVVDSTKPMPHYKKFPGGRPEPEDLNVPEFTAVRELFGETGVDAEPEDLTLLTVVHIASPRPHEVWFFRLELDEDPPRLWTAGDEGEEIFVLDAVELLTASDILPADRKAIESYMKSVNVGSADADAVAETVAS